jgi:hypothetical protein
MSPETITKGGLTTMMHAGLDLSLHRLDVHVLAEDGSTLKVTRNVRKFDR